MHVNYVATAIYRKPSESDRAWARRRHSARVRHQKIERARFRESQRRGRRFYAHGFQAVNRPFRLVSLDPGKITSGTVKATSLASHTVTATSIQEGRL